MFTTAHHLYVPTWARWIQSTPSYPVSLTVILILSPYLRQSLPSGTPSSGFLTKNAPAILSPPNTCHVSSLKWSPTECFERRTNHGATHYDIFSRLSLLPPCNAQFQLATPYWRECTLIHTKFNDHQYIFVVYVCIYVCCFVWFYFPFFCHPPSFLYLLTFTTLHLFL